MTPPERLVLTFNSAVDPSTCVTSTVTVQGSATAQPDTSVTFLPGGNCSAISSTAVQLELDVQDWGNLQGNINVATTSGNTFISLMAGFIQSSVGDSSLPTTSAIQVTTFTANLDPPSPVQVALFLDGFIGFVFTEAVNTQTINPTGITIRYTDRTTGDPGALTLSGMGNTDLFPGDTGALVQVSFTPEDLNSLKFNAIGPYSVQIAANSFFDANNMGNMLVTEFPIFFVAGDTTPPNLLGFDIDLNVGDIVLTFDEPMNTDTANVSIVTLASAPDLSGTSYTINDSMIVTATNMSTVITIQLEQDVLNTVKADLDVCVELSDCFLFAPPQTFADFGGVSNINGTIGVPGLFVPDMVSPQLTSYSVNLNNGTITIQFSEPIDSFQFSPAGISVTDSNGANPQQLEDSEVISVQDLNTIFTISIESSVLTDIKLFQRQGGILLTIDNTVALDTAGNMNVPISNGLAPSFIDADVTGPQLIGFVMSNPTQGQITLSFDEAVSSSTISSTEITVTFVSPLLVGTMFTLTGGSTISPDSDSITITLSEADRTNVFNDYNSSYFDGSFMLTATTNLVEDLFGNPLQELQMPIRYSNIPEPVLGFTLDLDVGQVSLSFVDPVDQNTLMYSDIYIAGFLMIGPTGYNLSGSSFVSSDINVTQVTFQLPVQLLNVIKFDQLTCSDISNCFMYMSPGSVADDIGNSILSRPYRLQAIELVADTLSPNIVEFTIDLNVGTLYFSFDEPVDPSSFEPKFLILYNDGFLLSTTLEGSLISMISALNSKVTVELRDSLNMIKVVAQGGSSLSLTVNESALTDISGNGINPIPISSAIQPSQFSRDITPPQMTRFMARQPSTRSILMFFDEYVDPSSFDGSQLKLSLNTLNLVISYNASYFSSGTTSSSISDMVTFTFSDTEFTEVFEAQYSRAFYDGFIGLTTNSALISDLNLNPLNAIEDPLLSNNASVIPDIVRPTFDSFSFDLNSGQLVMTFSENITLQVVSGRLTFQDAPIPVSSYTLAREGMNMVRGNVVSLTLDMADLNAIKNDPRIASVRATTYISLDPDFVQDMAGLTLDVSGGAIEASEFIDDTSGPTVRSVTMDVNAGTFSISFSEPVTTADAMLSEISLTGAQQSTPGSITMATSTIMITSLNAIISLSSDTLNQIKSDSDICTNFENCYVYLSMNAFLDFNRNPLNAPTTSFSVTIFVPDIQPPSLVSFDLDLTTGRVALFFDEPVQESSLDLTQWFVRNTDMTSFTTLGSGINPEYQSFNTILTITLPLSSTDLNRIKLFNSMGSVSMYLTSQAISDTNENAITPISSSNALLVSTLRSDIREPELLSFSPRPLEENRIIFSFDEFVNSSSWNGGVLTLTLRPPEGSFSYTLSEGMPASSDASSEIIYSFGGTMLSDQTFRTNYERAYERGFMTLGGAIGVVADLSGNLARGISPALMFMNNMTIESDRPEIVNFTFNSLNGDLVMVFTESVVIGTVVGVVSFQNLPNNPQLVYDLTQRGTINTVGNTVTLTLASVDLNVIRANPNLGTSILNTYLRLDPTFANDLNENPLLGRSAGLQASNVIGPMGQTELMSFDLDMNTGTITLNFNAVVQVSGLITSQVTIQSTRDSDAVSYTLSALSRPNSILNTDTVSITVSTNDLNQLKAQLGLATSAVNTYLSFPSTFAQDIFNSPVASIFVNDSLQVNTYILDVTPPTPDQFQLDMNSGLVELAFNEPIDPNSFRVVSVSIQSGATANPSSISYALTGGMVMSTGAVSTQVDFTMTLTDLNSIKAMEGLATEVDDSFIRFADNALSDVAGNSLNGQFLQAATYQRDIAVPLLQYFDLDLRDNVNVLITLQFNEPVVLDAPVTLPGITLQNAASGATTTLPLSSSDTLEQSTISSLQITLRQSYAIRVRNGQDIASSSDTFYISLGANTIRDYAFNFVQMIAANNAMRVRNICKWAI